MTYEVVYMICRTVFALSLLRLATVALDQGHEDGATVLVLAAIGMMGS